MTRVNVYARTDEYSEGTPELLGWFDMQAAERFDSGTHWDGSNSISIITGSQWVDEYLFRTKGGQWVLNHDASRYRNGPDTYVFITADEARDWLIRSENNDAAVERLFGELPEEEDRRVGRPEIGGAVHIRFGDDLLAMVDEYARQRSISRAEAIRRLTTDAVTRGRANA